MTLYIQASLGGEYQLQNDSDVFVSGIYWLSFHPPVKRFNKKVTLVLQHCACVGDVGALSFVTAKCTQTTRPYTFKELPGGSFSTPGYGTIEVDHFSAAAIVTQDPQMSFTIRTYYITKRLNSYEAHITVTQDMKVAAEVCIFVTLYSLE